MDMQPRRLSRGICGLVVAVVLWGAPAGAANPESPRNEVAPLKALRSDAQAGDVWAMFFLARAHQLKAQRAPIESEAPDYVPAEAAKATEITLFQTTS